MHENKSRIACFTREQALQEQAAQQGLSGFAVVARHEAITARMERGAEHIFQLIREGKHQEAHALLVTDEWSQDEQGGDYHCRGISKQRVFLRHRK